MAQFHISGRPRPLRVYAVVDPGEPVAAGPASAGRGLRSTVMQVPATPERRPPLFWAAVGTGGVVVVALALWLHPVAPAVETTSVNRGPAKPARPTFFAPSKPVLTDENWTYGRTGNPPRQVVPSQAAITAYKNEMERLAEKQKKSVAAIP